MDEIWGPPLKEYFNYSNDQPGPLSPVRRTASSSRDVLAAIEQLKNMEEISFQALENVLEIERHPPLLKYMRGQGMIPACIALVRNCHQKRKLLNCAYGYLSLRALCLVLEMCVIAHHPVFGASSEVGTGVNTLSESVANTLPGQIATSRDSNTPFLVWESSSSTAEPEVFPFAGGLTASDTPFLINALFGDRDVLLDVCLKFGLPGLSALLVILWQFAAAQRQHDMANANDWQ
ncbi:hypothetical protein FRC10_010375 [Ceratobasidium sp. 414]|nr:hypothetical protein FRC10_010375 [Ceratobasidium sp. 414]